MMRTTSRIEKENRPQAVYCYFVALNDAVISV